MPIYVYLLLYARLYVFIAYILRTRLSLVHNPTRASSPREMQF